jgi:predicted nucleic acid-binding Zn ribbon protein
MPTYDYHCAENNRVVEVKHSINEKLTTWGQVCANTGMDLGSTSADTPVQRLITGGQVVNSGTLKNPEPSCASGACCPSGMCGF